MKNKESKPRTRPHGAGDKKPGMTLFKRLATTFFLLESGLAISQFNPLFSQEQETAKPGEFRLSKSDSIRTAPLWSRWKKIHALDTLIKHEPNNAEAYYTRGVLFCGENFKLNLRAVEDFTKAVQLKPDWALAYNERGYALSIIGKDKEALADYDKAFSLDTALASSSGPRYEHGCILARMGRFEEARQDFSSIIRSEPEWANGAAYLRRADMLLLLNRFEDALLEYNQLLLMDGSDRIHMFPLQLAEVFCGRGIALTNLGNASNALPEFNKAIELFPRYIEAFIGRGDAHSALRNYNEAIADFEQAVKINPDDPLAYQKLGDALDKAGRHEESLKARQKASRLDQSQN